MISQPHACWYNESSVKMKFNTFSFILTDDCNFDCRYCRQHKRPNYMTITTIAKALDFFYPFFDQELSVLFYGGEPILALSEMQYAVQQLLEKNKNNDKTIQLSVTTNGSLLNDNILEFLSRHGFIVMLSFDGFSQEYSRQSGSMKATRQLAYRLQNGEFPGIDFSTNSVFPPDAVHTLSASMIDIIKSGVPELQLSLAKDEPWDDTSLHSLEKELNHLCDFLILFYKKTGKTPVRGFRAQDGPRAADQKLRFACDGGFNRMAITPKEYIWGCSLFHGYLEERTDDPDFKAYCFGKLDDFVENHPLIYPRILENYKTLKQRFFLTREKTCFTCDKLDICAICPLCVIHSSPYIGHIPPWMCRISSIQEKEEKRFLEEISKGSASSSQYN